MFKPTQQRIADQRALKEIATEFQAFTDPLTNNTIETVHHGRKWVQSTSKPLFDPNKGWMGSHTYTQLKDAGLLNAMATKRSLQNTNPEMMDYLSQLHKRFLIESNHLADNAHLDLIDDEWLAWASSYPEQSSSPLVAGSLPPARWSSAMKFRWSQYLVADDTKVFRRSLLSSAISRWRHPDKNDMKPGIAEVFRVAHLESPNKHTSQVYLQPQGAFLNIQHHRGRYPHDPENPEKYDKDDAFRPTTEEWLSPFTLLGINSSQITEIADDQARSSIRFGDYVIALRSYGDSKHTYGKTNSEYLSERGQYNMVLGENGIYDWVKRMNWKHDSSYRIEFVHVPLKLALDGIVNVPDWIRNRDETVAMAMLSIVASSVLHIDDESSPSPDQEARAFVPTWKDRRKPMDLEIGVVGTEYKHDLIRCSMCNGATIIKTPLTNRMATADCPHCKGKDSLLFPHLVDGGDIQVIFPRKESS